MSLDTFLYVPRMIILIMKDWVYDFGFMSFSQFELFTMELFVSIVFVNVGYHIYGYVDRSMNG